MNNKTKKAVVLLAPLLVFAILLVPYSLVNQRFIVDWLGCGCPIVDQSSNMVENYFNANDFTALFWLFITLCVTMISVFLSKRISREKLWLRILYIVGMLAVSLLISYPFIQMMLWNWQYAVFLMKLADIANLYNHIANYVTVSKTWIWIAQFFKILLSVHKVP